MRGSEALKKTKGTMNCKLIDTNERLEHVAEIINGGGDRAHLNLKMFELRSS